MIEICIGSACHINGSYQVVQEMKKLIAKHQVAETVELKSAFCLGHCGDGVSVRVDGETIHKVQPNEVDVFFNKYVLDKTL